MTLDNTVTLNFSAEYAALQKALKAPFEEINGKLTALRQQRVDTTNELNALSADELMTPAGIAKESEFKALLSNIETAIQRATNAKETIAKEHGPEARGLVKSALQTAKAKAAQEAKSNYGDQIEALRYQVTELDAQREVFAQNSNADFEQQALNWLSSLYHITDVYGGRVLEGNPYSLGVNARNYWPKA